MIFYFLFGICWKTLFLFVFLLYNFYVFVEKSKFMKKIFGFIIIFCGIFLASACSFNKEIVFDVNLTAYSVAYTGENIVPNLETATFKNINLEYYNSLNEKIDSMKDVGTYTVMASSVISGKTYSKNFNFTIRKAKCEFELNSCSVSYDGSTKVLTASVDLAEDYSLKYFYNNEETLPIKVGSYSVKCVLNSKNFYGEEVAELNINRAQLNLSATSVSYEYNACELAYTESVLGLPQNCEKSISYNGSASLPKNAGTYEVLIQVDTPLYYGECETQLVISKKEVELSISKKSFVYSGEEIDISRYATCPVPNAEIVVECEKTLKDAGVYDVKVSLKNANYFASYSCKIEIEKKALECELAPLKTEFSGVEQEYVLPDNLKNENVSVLYNGLNSLPVNAGVYEVSVKLISTNFSFEGASVLTINKAEKSVNLLITEFVYSGQEVKLENSDGLKIVCEYFQGESGVSKLVNAGTYTAKVKIEEPNYYGEEEKTIIIKQKEVSVLNFVNLYYLDESFVASYNLSENIETTESYFSNGEKIEIIENAGAYEIEIETSNLNYFVNFKENFVVVFNSGEDMLEFALNNLSASGEYSTTLSGTMAVTYGGVFHSYNISGTSESENFATYTYKSSATYPIDYGFKYELANDVVKIEKAKTNNRGVYAKSTSEMSEQNFYSAYSMLEIWQIANSDNIQTVKMLATTNGTTLTFNLNSNGLSKFETMRGLMLSSEIDSESVSVSVLLDCYGNIKSYEITSKFEIDSKNASEILNFVIE